MPKKVDFLPSLLELEEAKFVVLKKIKRLKLRKDKKKILIKKMSY